MSNALDRLNGLMQNDSDEIVITGDEYFEDVAKRINNRFEEVSLDDEPAIATEEKDDNIPEIEISEPVIEKPITETPITEVKTPEIEINVSDVGENIGEELFNNNAEIKKPRQKGPGRPKKNVNNNINVPTAKPEVKVENISAKIDSETNPLYNQLVNNLIDDLRLRKYTYNGFSTESMEILFQYIQNKF